MRDLELEGLDKTDEELRREIGRARMNALTAMPHDDWQRKGVNACQLMYARLIAGQIPPEERKDTERLILGLIECGGWPLYQHDIRVIRLAIIGTGNAPGRPLRYSREQDHAERTAS
jgi:hypothetical protein